MMLRGDAEAGGLSRSSERPQMFGCCGCGGGGGGVATRLGGMRFLDVSIGLDVCVHWTGPGRRHGGVVLLFLDEDVVFWRRSLCVCHLGRSRTAEPSVFGSLFRCGGFQL